MSESLVKVEGVSKKFCRSLKRSLWYGLKDLGSEVFGRLHDGAGELRPDEFWAVQDVNFELHRGECLGLIGPNGAGKSTLLKMLNGLIKPDQGRIEMRGRVGALIELGAGFNPILTGRENIYVNGAVLGYSKNEIDLKYDAIVDFSELNDFIETPVQNYSSGMKVKLGFAIASELNVDVLLLDEVLAVGDIAFRLKCLAKINDMIRDSAVIMVSHDMKPISRYCTKAIHLSGGKVEKYGKPSSVIDNFLYKQKVCVDSFVRNNKMITNLNVNGSSTRNIEVEESDDINVTAGINIGLNYNGEFMARIVIKDLSDDTVSLSECVIANTNNSDVVEKVFDITCNIPPYSLFPGYYWIDYGIHSSDLKETYELINNGILIKINGACNRYGGYKARLLSKWNMCSRS